MLLSSDKLEICFVNSLSLNQPPNTKSPWLADTKPTFPVSTVGLVSASQGDLVFGGWFSDKELTKQISSLSLDNNNDTIYGAFYPAGTAIRTASFKANETTLLDIILPAGGNVVVPGIDESIIPTGYKFVGFSDGINTYSAGAVVAMPDSNVEFNAVFEINSYTITFDAAGGDHVESITQDYNSTIDYSTLVLKRTGYVFVGWDMNHDDVADELPTTMPAYNFTVHAIWKPITYIIRYNANGATSGVMLDQEVKYDELATLQTMNYVYPGHQFIGWSTGVQTNPSYEDNDKVKNLSSTQDEVVNLYAIWKSVLSVTYNSQGGTEVPTASVLWDEYLQVPEEPTRTGYTFIGWYREATCLNEFDFANTKVQSSMTLYAKWEINQYTITIVYGNGQADRIITQNYGTNIPNISNPTMAGYRFAGWDQEIPTTMPGEDLIIVAKWEKQIKVTFKSQDNVVETQTLDVGSTITAPTLSNRTGFTFAGWDLNGDYVVDTITTAPENDVTYTALWTYRITITSTGNYGSIVITTTSGSQTIQVRNTNNQSNAIYEGTLVSIVYTTSRERNRTFNLSFDNTNYKPSVTTNGNNTATLTVNMSNIVEGNFTITVSRN